MTPRFKSIIIYFTLLTFTSGCFRYEPLPETAEALPVLKKHQTNVSSHKFCEDVLLTKVRSKEIFFWKAECAADFQEKCKLLNQAHLCGHPEARREIEKLDKCFLQFKPSPLNLIEESGTTTFSHGKNRMAQCGLNEEVTPTGYVLFPFAVVIGVPVILVFGTIGCLLPIQGCPLTKFFE